VYLLLKYSRTGYRETCVAFIAAISFVRKRLLFSSRRASASWGSHASLILHIPRDMYHAKNLIPEYFGSYDDKMGHATHRKKMIPFAGS